LIIKASEECDKVVVSIFVNPIQFAPNEDFDRYPRQMDSDQKICEKHAVDIIFAPGVKDIYPEPEYTEVMPPSSYQDKLCGKTRAGHFNGVATVVLKLFNIVQPDKSYFGQKDAQQLAIIKKITRDLNMPVEIIGCPIIRDGDGLALSSRNAYLSEEEKKIALSLYDVLKNIESGYKEEICVCEKLINSSLQFLHPDVKLEYLEVLNPETLQPADTFKESTLVVIAAKVGNVRLIDNLLI
jgi:pantoate--beta-alanine ligase